MEKKYSKRGLVTSKQFRETGSDAAGSLHLRGSWNCIACMRTACFQIHPLQASQVWEYIPAFSPTGRLSQHLDSVEMSHFHDWDVDTVVDVVVIEVVVVAVAVVVVVFAVAVDVFGYMTDVDDQSFVVVVVAADVNAYVCRSSDVVPLIVYVSNYV